MEQSSSEKQLRIRKQFDSFCKTLIKTMNGQEAIGKSMKFLSRN